MAKKPAPAPKKKSTTIDPNIDPSTASPAPIDEMEELDEEEDEIEEEEERPLRYFAKVQIDNGTKIYEPKQQIPESVAKDGLTEDEHFFTR